jgi:hypothetical protein
MGWLFAVAIGFQERRLRAVLTALAPITLGHALSLSIVALLVGTLGLVIPQGMLLMVIGLALIGFAVVKIATRFRHPRWVGMHLKPRELVLWSFLMATAHGAGLMLAPVIASLNDPAPAAANAQGSHLMPDGQWMQTPMKLSNHSGHETMLAGEALVPAVASVLLHSAMMLVVAAVIAMIVYQKIGVGVLRRAWINLDFLWFGAFLLTGVLTLLLGLRSIFLS